MPGLTTDHLRVRTRRARPLFGAVPRVDRVLLPRWLTSPGREAGGGPEGSGGRGRNPRTHSSGLPRPRGLGSDLPSSAGAASSEETVTNKLTYIDHVGIATQDLDAAVDLYRRTLGTEPAHRERVQDQGVEEVMFALGSSFIQLLGALDPDTPVGRFL